MACRPRLSRLPLIRALSAAASLAVVGGLTVAAAPASADSLSSVRADIAAWAPKVMPGGWLSGDDYHPEWWPGVVAAVGDSLPEAGEWHPGQWRWVS